MARRPLLLPCKCVLVFAGQSWHDVKTKQKHTTKGKQQSFESNFNCTSIYGGLLRVQLAALTVVRWIAISMNVLFYFSVSLFFFYIFTLLCVLSNVICVFNNDARYRGSLCGNLALNMTFPWLVVQIGSTAGCRQSAGQTMEFDAPVRGFKATVRSTRQVTASMYLDANANGKNSDWHRGKGEITGGRSTCP